MKDIKITEKLLKKWQNEIDRIADKFGVNSVLFMKSLPKEMQVIIGNSQQSHYQRQAKGPKSNYHKGCQKLYCEKVVNTGEKLLVKDASKDLNWEKNDDLLSFGLGTYLGFPVLVDEKVFGTVCALHNKEYDFSTGKPSLEAELLKLKLLIEVDLSNL